MFFPDSQSQSGLPSENPPLEDESDGLYFVDFGPRFGEEIQKVLRYRDTGMLCEIVFWQDGYSF